MCIIYKPVILFLVCTPDKIKSTQDTYTGVSIASLVIEKNVGGTIYISIDRE